MINSYSTAADFQQPRDFGQKISAVFDFLRVHLRPLLMCIVQYTLPVPLAGFIAAGFAQKLFFPGYQPTGLRAVAELGSSPAVLLSYLPLILGQVLLILTVYGYVLIRMETPPAELVPPKQVGRFVRYHFFSTLGSFLLMMVVLVFACMLFLIPGIWLSMPAALFFMVRLAEDHSFGSAFSRSVALVKDHWWATFGLLLVVFFIQWVLPFIVGVVGSIALALGASLLGRPNVDWPILGYAFVAVSNLLSLVMYTLLLLTIAFQYFNLVELKEGRSIYSLLDQLGQPAPVTVADRRYQADEEGEY